VTPIDPSSSRNSFDFLRLLFAGMVCLVHTSQLSGFEGLAWLLVPLSSDVAVRAFFVISGYLIFASYERSSSAASYFDKRVRRIYPAYAVVIVLCALGLFAVSTRDAGAYFSWQWVKYLLANLVFLNFLQPTLPGVFESNIVTAVNGALWTLKIEVMFYLSVPLLVLACHRLGRLPVLVGGYLGSVAYAWGLATLAAGNHSGLYAELGRQLPGQLCYFLAGALLWYYRAGFARQAFWWLLGAVLVLGVNMVFALPLLEPAALAVVVIFLGLLPHFSAASRHGDFSYGVYILHFPVIQLFVQAGWFRGEPLLFLLTIVLVVLTAAAALWHLVEKHFLLRRNHYLMSMT